ncbi:MAG TPA: imidazolonepropionase [Thermoplasmata archaeon]|nr:imidazolonepropionase [Thermoplasmata archaeon]
MAGPPDPRTHELAAEMGLIEDGAVYIEGERVVDVGRTSEVVARHPQADTQIDATGKVVLPGFVDPHTHAVFAGSREREVEWKAQGLTYAEIAARGGGILETVQATRKASEADLARIASDRLRTMMGFGTTTVEVKSGYGLRTDDELKILRAAAKAGALAKLDVISTFLGAHAVPPENTGKTDAYVDLVAGEMLDAVVSAGIAAFCDVFVDDGYFTSFQGRRILEQASQSGLRPKVHADELKDTDGASLAADVGATSADHLLHSSSDGIDAMARRGVIGVLLPSTSLTSHLPFADGRRLVAAGVPVALGTDFNPNTWCESMQLVIALACHHTGLVPAEAIVAATINAAHAVGRGADLGGLERGKQADLVVLDVPSYRHLGYRVGGNAVHTVIKSGRIRIATSSRSPRS